MNNQISIILKKIIKENGTNICNDKTELKQLLFNLCEDNIKEINLILLALEQNIAQEILNLSEDYIDEIEYERLVSKLYEEVGIIKENSRWVVKVWAEALGKNVTSDINKDDKIKNNIIIMKDNFHEGNTLSYNNDDVVDKGSLKFNNYSNIRKIVVGLVCFIILGGIIYAVIPSTKQSKSVEAVKESDVNKTSTNVTTDSSKVNSEDNTDKLNNKSFSMVGTINNNLNIHMEINFSNNEVTGTYYYDKYKQNIKLKGTYDKDNNVKLNEFDENNNITGVFNGKSSNTGEFNGTWSNLDGSRQYSFSVCSNASLEYSSNDADGASKNNSNQESSSMYTSIKNFDYSNRYVEKEYQGVDTKSNSGDAVTDSINENGWKLFNDTNKLITDVNNHIQKTYTVNWGFRPKSITYNGNNLTVNGEFYNNNQYATIENIRNLQFSIVDSNNKIIAMKDFTNDNNISTLILPYNKTISYSFAVSNVPSGVNLTNYATIISSDFDAIADEEKIKRDHPEVYNAVQYYKDQATQYYQKMQQKSEEYVNMVIQFERDRVIDASNY